MAASAQLLLDALSSKPGGASMEPDSSTGSPTPTRASTARAPYSFAEPPLTSEPPLADAAPLTSEVPISAELPLTSEPTAAGLGTESMEV